MRRRLLAVAAILALLLGITPAAFADTSSAAAPFFAIFKIWRSTYTDLSGDHDMDGPTLVQDGRVLVPVRFLAHALGLTDDAIQWDAASQSVTLTRGTTTVKLAVGSTELVVNGQSSQMDTAPVVLPPGRLMLPARYVAEAFGFTVTWDQQKAAVVILRPGTSLPQLPAAPAWVYGVGPYLGAVGPDFMDVAWTAPVTTVGVAEYHLYQDGQLVARVDGSTTHYRVTGLSPNHPYAFSLQAIDQNGRTSGSVRAQLWTTSTTPSPLTLSSATADGLTFTLTYSAPLDPAARPDLTDFAIAVDGRGVPPLLFDLTIADNQVVLTPHEGRSFLLNDQPYPVTVPAGAAVTIAYNPGNTPLRDLQGHTADPQPAFRVINRSVAPTLLAVVGDGLALRLRFDRPLDTTSVPQLTDFTVISAGVVRRFDQKQVSLRIEGDTLSLRLPLSQGEAATVQYTPGSAPLRSSDGAAVRGFGPIPVDNQSTVPLPAWLKPNDGVADGHQVGCTPGAPSTTELRGNGWTLSQATLTDCLAALTPAVSADGYLSLTGKIAAKAHWSAVAIHVASHSLYIPVKDGQFQVLLPLGGPQSYSLTIDGLGPDWADGATLATAKITTTAAAGSVTPVWVLDPTITISQPLKGGGSYTDKVPIQATLAAPVPNDTLRVRITGPGGTWGFQTLYVQDGRIDDAIWLKLGAGKYTITIMYDGPLGPLNTLISFEAVNTGTRDLAFLAPSDRVQSNNAEISSLAATITAGQADGMAKLRAIYDWVSTHIAYDTDAYFNNTSTPLDALSTLHRKMGVSSRYAILTAALTRSIGIPARVISGKGLINGSWGDRYWNEAYIDGRWVTLDTAYGAGSVGSDKQFHAQFSAQYFDPDPAAFATDHASGKVDLRF
ncbi:MAG: stalk domain-containing protein [Mycobacterium leprae]